MVVTWVESWRRQGWILWMRSSARYMQARAAASFTWRTLTCPTKVPMRAARLACTLPTSRKPFRGSNQQVGPLPHGSQAPNLIQGVAFSGALASLWAGTAWARCQAILASIQDMSLEDEHASLQEHQWACFEEINR